MEEVKDNQIFSEEELLHIENFFNMYKKENGMANMQEIIDNLSMMEEFNTQIILKVLNFVRKKNKSVSKLKRHQLPKFRTFSLSLNAALGYY